MEVEGDFGILATGGPHMAANSWSCLRALSSHTTAAAGPARTYASIARPQMPLPPAQLVKKSATCHLAINEMI